MQSRDLRCDPAMSGEASPNPWNTHQAESETNGETQAKDNGVVRRERPSRASAARAAARLYAAAVSERKQKVKKERRKEKSPVQSPPPPTPQCKIVTPLVVEPPPSLLPRWSVRSMWQLASVLNFLNVFRSLLNIKVEFSAEEFETALISPNNTLAEIHIPLLKAIPPITRMALGHNTWITVLCRKLRDWWYWVAEGELPIVASQGAEVEAYNTLDPGVRVVILKALCDIRVEQEDIRNYIDNSVKHGVQLSAFRKERIGGDSYGISYWYEDDPSIGHRLYREIRKVEVKKVKGKNVQPIPNSSYLWEAVATNLDEFQDVSEKLFSSKNRTEVSVGKKLKNDMLPEIEKVHKRRERLLKKQQRQALLLDNMVIMDGLAPGRSLRDRKHVTYTFDDYDRSIDEAIKITKQKQPSPEPTAGRVAAAKPDPSTNGRWISPSRTPLQATLDTRSLTSSDYDEMDVDRKPESLNASNRRRQRPWRYLEKEYFEAVSEIESDFHSDDDIVGEVVYEEEYLRRQKQRRTMSSSSGGDEEYHLDEEHAEDEEEEEEEDDADSLNISEDSDQPKRFKKLPGRTRRETKLRSINELQPGLRRSKRATRNRINYRQYELSESEAESMKPESTNASDEHTDTDRAEFSTESQESEGNNDNQDTKEVDQPAEGLPETTEKEQNRAPEKSKSPDDDEFAGVRKRQFLDLNELAPGSGFEDGPNSTVNDQDPDDF
ncbi:DDT domain-containing protein DDR4-like [Diospyros lotus]|uniref:DDT domain-containing protein DDR4-like n=1 Tax=Diospyros lotus TaxID=55363 RepID=UPI0022565812|nr:DDT domain-containing protein DDR4-like [Diospyros lotus]